MAEDTNDSAALQRTLIEAFSGSTRTVTQQEFALATANFLAVRDISMALMTVLGQLDLSLEQRTALSRVFPAVQSLMDGIEISVKLLGERALNDK